MSPSPLDYGRPPRRSLSIGTAFGVCMFAAAFTLVFNFWFPFWVSNLPRATQGESVNVPWWACAAASLILPVVVPCTVARVATRNVGVRLTLLLALAASSLFWFWLGGHELLSKAWRRGL